MGSHRKCWGKRQEKKAAFWSFGLLLRCDLTSDTVQCGERYTRREQRELAFPLTAIETGSELCEEHYLSYSHCFAVSSDILGKMGSPRTGLVGLCSCLFTQAGDEQQDISEDFCERCGINHAAGPCQCLATWIWYLGWSGGNSEKKTDKRQTLISTFH